MARKIIKSKRSASAKRDAIVVRAGADLWEWLGEQADLHGMSRNDLVVTVLETFRDAAGSLDGKLQPDWDAERMVPISNIPETIEAVASTGTRRALVLMELVLKKAYEGKKR